MKNIKITPEAEAFGEKYEHSLEYMKDVDILIKSILITLLKEVVEYVTQEVAQELAQKNAQQTTQQATQQVTLQVSQEKVQKTVKKKDVAPRIVPDVFTYRYQNVNPQGSIILYQDLLKIHLIDKDTKPEDFVAIFDGKPSNVKVKWIESQATLKYLFDRLLKSNCIMRPDGVQPWIIVQSHFVNGQGRVFRNFNKQHEPKKFKSVLDYCADKMNLARQE